MVRFSARLSGWNKKEKYGGDKQPEGIFREVGDVEGLAISLANQASLLGLRMGRPREAVALAEEAYGLASGHGLVALAGQVKGILDEIRQAAGR